VSTVRQTRLRHFFYRFTDPSRWFDVESPALCERGLIVVTKLAYGWRVSTVSIEADPLLTRHRDPTMDPIFLLGPEDIEEVFNAGLPK